MKEAAEETAEETAEESEGVIPPATEAERAYAQRYNQERNKEVRK